MSRFVADSSLTIAWYLYADAALVALTCGDEAIVPPLWPYEVANALVMAVRRGRLQASEIPRVLGLLAPLPIQVQASVHERARQEVLALALQESLTSYDAAYLELAMREGIPLATLDARLNAAAARIGVPTFAPP